MKNLQLANSSNGFWFFLCTIMFGCGVLPSSSLTTNIPSHRLFNNTYSSPDGEYTAELPSLIKPGAKIEEHQKNPVTHGVFFADDFGKVYFVLRTDNRKTKYTLENISDRFKIGNLLRVKQYIETDRGKELRLLGINKQGSPVVTRTKENGKWIARKNDLYEAWSLFMHGTDIYQVTAGISALHDKSENVLFNRAENNLEKFLNGLKIKPTK